MVGIRSLIRQAMERAKGRIFDVIEEEIDKLMDEDDRSAPAKRRGRPPKGPGERPTKGASRRGRLSDTDRQANARKVLSAVKDREGSQRADLLATTRLDEYRLTQAIDALLAEKLIRKEGERRARRYFLASNGGGSSKKTATTKKSAKKTSATKKAAKKTSATKKGAKKTSAKKTSAFVEAVRDTAAPANDGVAAV